MRAGRAARRAVVLVPWIAWGCGTASPTGVPDSGVYVLDGGMGADATTGGPGHDGGSSADAAPTSSDATPGGADAGAPVLATVHFLGRFDTRDAAGPRFAWPGSAIAATFQGTGITVSLTDTGTNDFAVVVDGAAPVKLATAGKSKTYSLASNLTAGQHTVV